MTQSDTIYQTARTRDEVVKLLGELERRSKTAKDIVLPASRVRFETHEGSVRAVIPSVGAALQPLPLTPTAHQQTGDKLRIPKPYYDRCLAEAPELLATNVNEWCARDDRKWMFRTLDGRIRANLSDRYRALDSFDLAFAGLKIAKDVGAEISRVNLTDDRFEMRLIHPEWREDIGWDDVADGAGRHLIHRRGPSARLIPGAYLSNSETGRGGLAVKPFVLDAICSNGYVGEATFGRVHLGERLGEGSYLSDETRKAKDAVVWQEVSDLLHATFDRERFKALVEQFKGAATQELANPIEAVDAVVSNYALSDDDRQAILNELISPSHDRDPGRTIFGLISAVTQRGQAYDNPERQTDFEEIGATLLQKAAGDLVAIR